MVKRYWEMWMWLFEAKLKVKTAPFRLPSASQKRVCLSSLIAIGANVLKCISYVFNLTFLGLCRDDGFLKSIQSVKFTGVSRDPVSFDSNGNGLGAYDIMVVNKETEQWEPIGSWISNTSNVLDLPENVSFLDLNLTKLRMFWQKVFNSSVEPTSFCGQQCPPGHLMLSDERHQVCCFCLFFNLI